MELKTAKLLDGKALANKIYQELSQTITQLQSYIGRAPGLAVLMLGDNPASAAYVAGKEKACAKVGITSFSKYLPTGISHEDVIGLIKKLNQDENIDGILVQLPLPDHLDPAVILQYITPEKDVDGLHSVNLGKLMRRELGLRSCTPAGVMRLLQEYNIPLEGKQAVVVGRSILVGKPLALMLLEVNATVTIAHSHSENLPTIAKNADILIAAVGRPEFITAEMVKSGAVVVDVGINRIADPGGRSRLVGDVDFASVHKVADFVTPVPGGVGPMTVAMLLQNTVASYQLRAGN